MTGQTVILRGPAQYERAKRMIDQAPLGSEVHFREAKRTNPQNDRFWAMVGDLMAAKPEGRDYDKDGWRSVLMAYAGFKAVWEPSLDGRGVVPVGYKSSRLTKAEFSDLIMAAQSYGDEHGVKWSVPEWMEDMA